MEKKLNKQNFSIEGWFPPCIANTLYGKYACCGGNWVAIEDDVTISDVTKGWICTAPKYEPKVKKVSKRITKKQLYENLIK